MEKERCIQTTQSLVGSGEYAALPEWLVAGFSFFCQPRLLDVAFLVVEFLQFSDGCLSLWPCNRRVLFDLTGSWMMFECVCVCVYTNDETTERRRERVKGKKKKKKASRADQYELLAESSAGRILHFSFIRPSIHPSIQSPGHLLFSFLFPPTPKSREIQKEKRKQKREKLNSAQAPSSTPSSQTAQDDKPSSSASLPRNVDMTDRRNKNKKKKKKKKKKRTFYTVYT